jgi:hypothetical protein
LQILTEADSEGQVNAHLEVGTICSRIRSIQQTGTDVDSSISEKEPLGGLRLGKNLGVIGILPPVPSYDAKVKVSYIHDSHRQAVKEGVIMKWR